MVWRARGSLSLGSVGREERSREEVREGAGRGAEELVCRPKELSREREWEVGFEDAEGFGEGSEVGFMVVVGRR